MQLDNYELSRDEQGQLASFRVTEGFKVLNRILKSEVFKQLHLLICTPVTDREAVVANHTKAVAAVQIYDGLIQKINAAVTDYTGSIPSDKPIDFTDGLLDLGEYVRGE